ncbi:MAG: ribokinase [Chloroflexota bacterium]|nr:ribokinase [Dehalococcoidia bacterium]MDW8254012.1 ribokinase [Chloroflexota bacterium]
MPEVVVVGSLVIDVVFRVARQPVGGETLTAEEAGVFLGGKGFNQAVAARRAGATVALVGQLGDDLFAPLFEAALDREGIDRRCVQRGGSGTGISVPIVDREGHNTLIVAPRANLILPRRLVDAARALIAASRVVVAQRETSIESIRRAGELAREAGATFLWNAAPAGPVDPALFALADILVVNEQEAEAFAGLSLENEDCLREAARRLQQRGPATVIVTLGERGAFLLTGGRELRLNAIRVDAVDATGAGDAFVGAFAARLAAGDPVERAVRFANAAGALAVTTLGAEPAMPTRAAIERLLAAVPPAYEA